jgi:hypothetical protein
MMDRLIHGIGVDLADAVAVDRCLDVAEQLGQLRLVVGADPFPRGAIQLWCPVLCQNLVHSSWPGLFVLVRLLYGIR